MTELKTVLSALARKSVDLNRFPEAAVVADFEENLQRSIFKLGGRTNPKGYYLNVMLTGIPGTSLKAQLKSANDLMRLELETTYRSYRNDWFRIFEHHIPYKLRPKEPLHFARVMFTIWSRRSEAHMMDAEAKYSSLNPLLASLYNPAMKHSAVKPLLDTMQANTQFRGSGRDVTRRGIGLLRDDTDGEHGRGGAIRQLEVVQAQLPRTDKTPRLELTIEEVGPWTL